MGTMTLSEMKVEVRAAFGGANNTSMDSRLTSLFNLAQTRLARKHDFEELKTRGDLGPIVITADPTADMTIALPTSPRIRQLYTIVLVDGTNSRKLTQVTNKEWETRIPYGEEFSTGRPDIYKRWGDTLYLWRVPDAVYQLRSHYSTWPTAFSTDETVTSDLDDKDDLLITLVDIWAATSLDRPDRANYFWAIFKSMYEEAFQQSIYQADLDGSGKALGGSTSTDYWKNPWYSGPPGEQTE